MTIGAFFLVLAGVGMGVDMPQAPSTPEGPASVIVGRVVGASEPGAPVRGARVGIDSLGLETRTDSLGRFALGPVSPGQWTLRVDAPGHRARTIRVLVPEADTVHVDLRLEPSDPGRIGGRVVDGVSGAPVPAAEVRTGSSGASTGRDGAFELEVDPASDAALRVRAFGYAPLDTLLRGGETTEREIVLTLAPRPVDMIPLTVEGAYPSAPAARLDRALFDREPRPGVVAVTGDDLRRLPFLIERDVLRSLDALLPGVVRINDLSARLHIQGGAPDQNLVLLDGAPILAPYHLFGIFGVLDPGTVGKVELFRGSIPARYGGALSSVLEVEQRTDSDGRLDVEAGIGLLSARAMARGDAADGRIRWMVAGRRSVTDLALEGLGLVDQSAPFHFQDGQARVEWTLGPDDVVRASAYGSRDDFTMFLEGGSADVRSIWANRVASLRWDRKLGGSWTAGVLARHTGVHSEIRLGGSEGSPVTSDDVGIDALRLETRRRGSSTGAHLGVEVERASTIVDGGARLGGYVEGRSERSRTSAAAWVELERRIGAFRLTPGLRGTMDTDGRFFLAPRLAARLHLGEDRHLTVGLDRTHQLLSTLRDDRHPLPGPPIWAVRGPDEPGTVADQASVAWDGWLSGPWHIGLSLWARRFLDVPVWRPTGDRTPIPTRFDDGRALGGEVIVRFQGARVRAWLGYAVGHSVLDDDGRTYDAPWDRRHSLQLAAFVEPAGRWRVSTQVSYGSGTPFWPQTGEGRAVFLDPRTGTLGRRDFFPIWGDRQLRFPSYFRADIGGGVRFGLAGALVDAHASLVNVTGRENVLYYDYRGPSELGGRPDAVLEPAQQLPFSFLPSLRIDVRF